MSICSHLCLMMEVQSPHSHSWGRTTCWMEGNLGPPKERRVREKNLGCRFAQEVKNERLFQETLS